MQMTADTPARPRKTTMRRPAVVKEVRERAIGLESREE
jgi:hypothetical protein